MTLKEAVKEIEKEGEERRLVSKFEAKHRDWMIAGVGFTVSLMMMAMGHQGVPGPCGAS